MEIRVDIVAERIGQFTRSRQFTKKDLEEAFEIIEHPTHRQRLNPLERLLFSFELLRRLDKVNSTVYERSFLEGKVSELWNELLSPEAKKT